jgi:plasmid stabilization system protein ParE
MVRITTLIVGKEFRDEARIAIDKLADEFVDYQIYFGKIRKTKLDRFPYYIYYERDEVKSQIVVIAIMHFKRNPDTIKGLLRK